MKQKPPEAGESQCQAPIPIQPQDVPAGYSSNPLLQVIQVIKVIETEIFTVRAKSFSPCSRFSKTCQNCGRVWRASEMAAVIAGSSSSTEMTLSFLEQAGSKAR